MAERVMQVLRGDAPATVVVSVSGGSDSVALLLRLDEVRREGLDIVLHVAHLDHGIRGKEARGDREFVEALAARLGLPFTGASVDVPAEARTRKLSLEHAARECRYAFLEEVARRAGASFVALGHTADDQAETVLHRLLRGAGIHGLAGMPEMRPLGEGIRIIRPLLDVSRAELMDWLRRRGESWRTDRTNVDETHTRNRIRHKLIPTLLFGWPTLRQDLADFARTMRALDDLLMSCALDWLKDHAAEPCTVDRAALATVGEPLRSFVLRELIARTLGDLRRIDEKHVAMVDDLLASGTTGASIDLPRGLVVRCDYGTLRFALRRRPLDAHLGEATRSAETEVREAPGEMPLVIPGETRWGEWIIRTEILEGDAIGRDLERLGNKAEGETSDETTMDRFIETLRRRDPSGVEYLDYDRLLVVSSPLPSGEGKGEGEPRSIRANQGVAGLLVRSRRNGDRITPLGSAGRTKLKDFLIRRKVPRVERDLIPLIVGREVLIAAGLAVSDVVALSTDTQRILRVTIERRGSGHPWGS